MRFIVGTLLVFKGNVCIYLRSGDGFMTQKFLDGNEIDASLQQMGGKGMPQRVRACFVFQLTDSVDAAKDLPNVARTQAVLGVT